MSQHTIGIATIGTEGRNDSKPHLDTDPLPIFWRGDPEYEEARVGRVFNHRRPARYPVAILNARSVSDVIRGVNIARERGIRVAIRSGGHSWAVWSVRSETLLIDLGQMRECSYDTTTQLATCSTAVTGGELNPYLAKYGRFFGGGHCPTVGLGGFLLQGGQGWWARALGWACEQIHSIDVVLPDGTLVTASDSEYQDLFWAAKGAGPGFFGVVVRLRLNTMPRPLAMNHVTYILPAKDNYDDVFKWLQTCCQYDLDPFVETVMLSFTRSRLFGPDMLKHGQDPMEPMLVIRGVSMSDSEAAASRMLAPLLQIPHRDKSQQLADNPPGHYFAQNTWLRGDPDSVADSLKAAFTTLPSKQSFFLWYAMGPLRPLPKNMAFSLQTEHYTAGYIISQGNDEDEQERCRKWLKDRYDYIDSKKDGPGGTIGLYLGDSDLATRPGKIMTDENWGKWCTIRDKYDPNRMLVGFLNGENEMNAHAWEQKGIARSDCTS